MGGAEVATEVGAGGMAAHQDDHVGAELSGCQHPGKTDGAVADDDHGCVGHDAALMGCVVPGEVDIGQCQQQGHQHLVGSSGDFHRRAVGQRDAQLLGVGRMYGDAMLAGVQDRVAAVQPIECRAAGSLIPLLHRRAAVAQLGAAGALLRMPPSDAMFRSCSDAPAARPGRWPGTAEPGSSQNGHGAWALQLAGSQGCRWHRHGLVAGRVDSGPPARDGYSMGAPARSAAGGLAPIRGVPPGAHRPAPTTERAGSSY